MADHRWVACSVKPSRLRTVNGLQGDLRRDWIKSMDEVAPKPPETANDERPDLNPDRAFHLCDIDAPFPRNRRQHLPIFGRTTRSDSGGENRGTSERIELQAEEPRKSAVLDTAGFEPVFESRHAFASDYGGLGGCLAHAKPACPQTC